MRNRHAFYIKNFTRIVKVVILNNSDYYLPLIKRAKKNNTDYYGFNKYKTWI